MKHWTEHLNAMAAGLLFDGGYVVAPARRAGQTDDCGAHLDAREEHQTHDAGRAPPRPSTKLATT